jgi:hypothetical protein
MKLDTKNKEETFKVRAYGYGELAQLYFPSISKKSASAQLRRWVLINEPLQEELKSVGLKKGQRILSPKQVEILITYFGEP